MNQDWCEMVKRREPDDGASLNLSEEAIAGACRLVGRGCARSVQVVVGRRLTYDEILRCRAWAAASAADLTMDGNGVLTIRPRTAAAPGAPPLPRRRWSWSRWLHAS